MKNVVAEKTAAEQVHVFDVSESLKRRDGISGRVDMARSPNSYVAVFQTRPRGGETHIHQHPDSDQILFILKGEVTVEGLEGKYVLRPNQGVLIPAGVHYGFTNTTQEDVIFLTIRTESTGGRRVAYVENVASNVRLKVPEAEIMARGIGRHIYVYAMDRKTFGVSLILHDDWNKASLLRMHCDLRLKTVSWLRHFLNASFAGTGSRRSRKRITKFFPQKTRPECASTSVP